jgi:hypothetical protein
MASSCSTDLARHLWRSDTGPSTRHTGTVMSSSDSPEPFANVINYLAELLKLPAAERVELAMALWERLTDEERDAELEL